MWPDSEASSPNSIIYIIIQSHNAIRWMIPLHDASPKGCMHRACSQACQHMLLASLQNSSACRPHEHSHDSKTSITAVLPTFQATREVVIQQRHTICGQEQTATCATSYIIHCGFARFTAACKSCQVGFTHVLTTSRKMTIHWAQCSWHPCNQSQHDCIHCHPDS